jgi:hypothetical protein
MMWTWMATQLVKGASWAAGHPEALRAIVRTVIAAKAGK